MLSFLLIVCVVIVAYVFIFYGLMRLGGRMNKNLKERFTNAIAEGVRKSKDD